MEDYKIVNEVLARLKPMYTLEEKKIFIVPLLLICLANRAALYFEKVQSSCHNDTPESTFTG